MAEHPLMSGLLREGLRVGPPNSPSESLTDLLLRGALDVLDVAEVHFNDCRMNGCAICVKVGEMKVLYEKVGF
jgi:hypothetical protein